MWKKLLPLAAAGVFVLGACSDDGDVYGEESHSDFMDTCTGGLGDESQCQCVWDDITENVPEEDAREFLESDQASAPDWLTEAMTSCMGG